MVKVLETSTISPPPSATADNRRPSTLPLTYFDLYYSHGPPVQNLFLYSLPSSTNLNTCISNLKHSLSLTLDRFYLLTGALVPAKPVGEVPKISYNEGDGILFATAECDDDAGDQKELFWELAGNHPREAMRFHDFVPDLKMYINGKQPVLAVQVTLFGNHGIGIGCSIHHGVIDGPSFFHFVKTWAFFTRLSTSMTPTSSIDVPFYDRSVIPHSERLLGEVRKIVQDIGENKDGLAPKIIDQTAAATRSDGQSMVVRATFVLTSKQLEKLHLWVLAMSSIHCSSFALASAVMWICSVKAKCISSCSSASVNHLMNNETTTDGFFFHSNCRGRPVITTTTTTTTTTERLIPSNYFGNCQEPVFVELKRSQLVGEINLGVLNASMAITKAIRDLKNSETPFENKSGIISKFLGLDTLLLVAASPRLGVYKIDFGWGTPEKFELVSTDRSSAMAILENKNAEEGGVEMGLVRPAKEMEAFNAIFHNMVESFDKVAKASL